MATDPGRTRFEIRLSTILLVLSVVASLLGLVLADVPRSYLDAHDFVKISKYFSIVVAVLTAGAAAVASTALFIRRRRRQFLAELLVALVLLLAFSTIFDAA